jgi:hypothetical protein
MSEPAFRCGVAIVARDEAESIGRCLDALREGLPAGFARVVVACNGCRDDTVAIARSRMNHEGWTVLDLPEPGKAGAIRAAERLLPDAPRLFIDADVAFRGTDLVRLVGLLETGSHHLLSPEIEHDLDGCGPLARSLNRTWRALPHARRNAFHHVLGVSAAGRRRWGEMPEVLGDDAFIASRFTPEERHVVGGMTVRVRPPRTLQAWIGVRERWLRGERQLRGLGLADPHRSPQGPALLRLAANPRTSLDTLVYTAVRAFVAIRVSTRRDAVGWYRDPTSRKATEARHARSTP